MRWERYGGGRRLFIRWWRPLLDDSNHLGALSSPVWGDMGDALPANMYGIYDYLSIFVHNGTSISRWFLLLRRLKGMSLLRSSIVHRISAYFDPNNKLQSSAAERSPVGDILVSAVRAHHHPSFIHHSRYGQGSSSGVKSSLSRTEVGITILYHLLLNPSQPLDGAGPQVNSSSSRSSVAHQSQPASFACSSHLARPGHAPSTMLP